MDGAMIFVDGEWREAKLGCCYETGDSGVINASYYATLHNSAVFGRKVRVLAHYSGLDRCSHTSVVADGARWIWQETGKYFPHSTQVLDFYHACEHLWQMANTRYGDGTSQAREWMKTQKEHLLDDKVDVVIKEVKAWKPRIAAKRELQRKLLEYLMTHRHRMMYASVEAKGYHIGSGVIEAGCKSVVKARMGGAGMRWSTRGAEAMLHLTANWHTSQQYQLPIGN